ncbi:MAG: hypothetical protein PHW04_09360 [Candidatus Wallbacteria bacterium]|nr:hypothetical protein [Candidatus Wallbacteria bacterium]
MTKKRSFIIFLCAVPVLIILISIPRYNKARFYNDEKACESFLNSYPYAAKQYLIDNPGKTTEIIENLNVLSKFIRDPGAIKCPASGRYYSVLISDEIYFRCTYHKELDNFFVVK